jgi:hypothetical protein
LALSQKLMLRRKKRKKKKSRRGWKGSFFYCSSFEDG